MTRPATNVFDRDQWADAVRTIRAEPDEDLHRLKAADWLDENGEAERAEFIRRSVKLARTPEPDVCELGPGETSCTDPECEYRRYEDLRASVFASLRANVAHWFGPGWDLYLDSVEGQCRVANRDRVGWQYVLDRGFVELAHCDAADWLAHGDLLHRREPVRYLVLTTRPSLEMRYRPERRATDCVVAGAIVTLSELEVTLNGSSVEIGPDDAGDWLIQTVWGRRWPGLEVELPPVEAPAALVAPTVERVRAELPTVWSIRTETEELDDTTDQPLPPRRVAARLTATTLGSPPPGIWNDVGREFGPINGWDQVNGWDQGGYLWDVRRAILSDFTYHVFSNTTEYRAEAIEFRPARAGEPEDLTRAQFARERREVQEAVRAGVIADATAVSRLAAIDRAERALFDE